MRNQLTLLTAMILASTIYANTAHCDESIPTQSFVQTCAGADDGQGTRSVFLINISQDKKTTTCQVAVQFGFEYGNTKKIASNESFGSAYEIVQQDLEGLKCQIHKVKSKMAVTVTNSDQYKLVDSCLVGPQILNLK